MMTKIRLLNYKPFVYFLLIVVLVVVITMAIASTRKSKVNAQAINITSRYQLTALNTPPLGRVDNLVLTDSGVLYATLEKPRVGSVVRVTSDGKVKTMVKSLNRPDGLLLANNRLYITEEIKNGRIIEFDLDANSQRTLVYMRYPEGIARYTDGTLLIAEDIVGGNIIKLATDGTQKILVKNLNRPEGLCLDDAGALFIAETGTGRVLKYFQNTLSVVVEGITEPDQLVCAKDGAIWISEDANPGRVFRFYKKKLYIIAENLKSPQGMVIGKDNIVYIAEQSGDRILKLTLKKPIQKID